MNLPVVNGAVVELNLGEKTVEELVALHNEMCLTAVDFGLAAETVTSFSTLQEGVAACQRLHEAIHKAKVRAAAPPKKERRKAANKEKAAAKKADKKSTADATVAELARSSGAVVAGYTDPKITKEKTVKKAAKKTKSAKKAKTAAKKATNGASRSRLPGSTTITWIADGNPARKGSIFFDRVEKVRKAKTVEGLIKAGGTGADAAECAKRSWAKLGKAAAA